MFETHVLAIVSKRKDIMASLLELNLVVQHLNA